MSGILNLIFAMVFFITFSTTPTQSENNLLSFYTCKYE